MARLPRAKKDFRQRQLKRALGTVEPSVLEGLGLDENSLETFQEQLEGRVVLPGDPDYLTDRRGNSIYPELPYPQMIVYCEVFNDVKECLDFARARDMPFSLRSGGHCTAGFSVSPGIVIDLSQINGVMVMPDRQSVIVGAGAGLGLMYAQLDPYGLHVPGGECDTVGVAGHMQGGGYGFTSRTFGLNCDVVERIWMMLADGQLVVADTTVNPDLFWAVRGGTGNQFGVLLQIQYRVAPIGDLWGFVLRWPADDAPQVLVELQKSYVRAGVTSDLGYQLCFGRVDDVPYFYMMGMYNGAMAEGKQVIAPLEAIGTPTMTLDKIGKYKDLNGELLAWFQMPPANTMEVKDCNYIAQALTVEQWQTIVDYWKTAPNPFNLTAMEVYGGRVTAGPSSPSAFIHRDLDFDLFTDSFSNEDWQYNDLAEAKKWLAGFDVVVSQFSNGHKYQDYPRQDNPNFRWNYWEDAFNSLLFVKTKYDPTNFFTFEQEISPYPDDASIQRSEEPSMFDDLGIVYEQWVGG